jgi:hypothetical protein
MQKTHRSSCHATQNIISPTLQADLAGKQRYLPLESLDLAINSDKSFLSMIFSSYTLVQSLVCREMHEMPYDGCDSIQFQNMRMG